MSRFDELARLEHRKEIAMQLKIWSRTKHMTVETKDIQPDTIARIDRYVLRGPSGNLDGCSVTLKAKKGEGAVKYLSEQNYSETCRDAGITAAGASGASGKPVSVPEAFKP